MTDWRPRFTQSQKARFDELRESEHESDKATMDRLLAIAEDNMD